MKWHSHISSFTAIALLACICLSEPAWGWWNFNWQYRRAVSTPAAKPTGLPGDDIAALTMHTGGLCKADGSDIRVADTDDKEVPCRVLRMGPGDSVTLAFATRPGLTKYFVYFGNAKAEKPAAELDIRRGVLLEMWAYPGGGVKTLDEVRKVFANAKDFIGRDFVDSIFWGTNPFGPQAQIASLYTGWLVCPVDGSYTFVALSNDSAMLLIDDKLVVDNGGWRRATRRDYKTGEVTLTAGLHKLTFYHVNMGGDPIAVAGWRMPKRDKPDRIPAESFAPVGQASPGAMEQYNAPLTIDFLPVHAGEAYANDRYYQRFTFSSLNKGDVGHGIAWTWDFGDGQTAESAQAEHVYLRPGEYTVSLKARAAGGELLRTNRIYVTRQWDKIQLDRLDNLHTDGLIVATYNFAALDDRAAADAVLLLDKAGLAGAMMRAGEALASREKVADEALVEAMPVYVAALLADSKAPQAASALIKAAQAADKPGARAAMLTAAGRVLLDQLNDADGAMKEFDQALAKDAAAAPPAVIRQTKIGAGDVWRARGNFEKAAEAYAQADERADAATRRAAITRGDAARRTEDYLRQGDLDAARQTLDDWADALPADKLDGYWSLLRCKLLTARRDYAGAAREADTLVSVKPASTWADQLLMQQAAAYTSMRQPAKAQASLERIVKSYPESPLARDAAKLLASPSR